MKSLQGAHRVHNLTRSGTLRAVRDIGALSPKTMSVEKGLAGNIVGPRYGSLPGVRMLAANL